MTPIIIAMLLSPAASEPALVMEAPKWAFVVPADREPSLPVDDFLARLDSAALERAIERDLAAQPFEVDEDPFDGRGTPIASAAVEEMIREGERVAAVVPAAEVLP